MDFKLSIVTPEGLVFEDQAVLVGVPGEAGLFGVMAGHAPLIAAARAGVLKVEMPRDQTVYFAISASLVEVSRAGMTVLADQAFRAASFAEAEARAARL